WIDDADALLMRRILARSPSRRTVTPKVAGSSPVAPARFLRDRQRSDFFDRRVPTFAPAMFTNKNGSPMRKSLTVKQVHKIMTEGQGLNAKHPPHPLGISGMTAMTANVVAYANDQRKLKQEIAGLSYDARMELMALMWIGRDFDGDYDAGVPERLRKM